MMANGVAFGGGALHQMRHGFGIVTDDEKRRFRAFFRQRVEHFRGRCGRAVVEGQHHFMIGEIERARIGLEPHGGGLGAADRQRAGDAQRLRPAVGVRGGDAGDKRKRRKNQAKGTRKTLHDGFAGLHPRTGGV